MIYFGFILGFIICAIGFRIFKPTQSTREITTVNEILPYQVGTKVYFVTQNKIHSAKIIGWTVYSSGARVTYEVDRNPAGSQYTTHFLQSDVSDSLEEIQKKIVATYNN